jgi:hypothetical protein
MVRAGSRATSVSAAITSPDATIGTTAALAPPEKGHEELWPRRRAAGGHRRGQARGGSGPSPVSCAAGCGRRRIGSQARAADRGCDRARTSFHVPRASAGRLRRPRAAQPQWVTAATVSSSLRPPRRTRSEERLEPPRRPPLGAPASLASRIVSCNRAFWTARPAVPPAASSGLVRLQAATARQVDNEETDQLLPEPPIRSPPPRPPRTPASAGRQHLGSRVGRGRRPAQSQRRLKWAGQTAPAAVSARGPYSGRRQHDGSRAARRPVDGEGAQESQRRPTDHRDQRSASLRPARAEDRPPARA